MVCHGGDDGIRDSRALKGGEGVFDKMRKLMNRFFRQGFMGMKSCNENVVEKLSTSKAKVDLRDWFGDTQEV